jgi:hypothetical protein
VPAELLVLINGEPIKLPHRFQQKVGTAVRKAFALSTQHYSKAANYRVVDRDGELLHPDSRVEYMREIRVWLDAGPLPPDAPIQPYTPSQSQEAIPATS